MSSNSPTDSSAARRFDLLLCGASGFTGQLVLEYLSAHYGQSLAIAIAGRNKEKLNKAKESARATNVTVFEVDFADRVRALEIFSQCRVLISTIGPFSVHGSPIVDLAIEAKCDYCDITGEASWIRTVIDKFHERARDRGVLVINAAGFDALPAELAAHAAVRELRRMGKEPGEVHSIVSITGPGTASGGTVHSVLALAAKNPSLRNPPFLLNSPGHRAPRPHDLDQRKPIKVTGFGWTIPFVMAGVNTRVVRKTAESLDYGPAFSYNECLLVGSGGLFESWLAFIKLVFFGLMIKFSWTRSIVARFAPKPGTGPSKQLRDLSGFTYTTIASPASSPGVPAVRVRIRGGDAGYQETSKMISETAIAILLNKHKLPQQFQSGVHSPGCLASVLLERLSACDNQSMKIQIEEINN